MAHLLERALDSLERAIWRQRFFRYIRQSETSPMPGVPDRDWAGQLGSLDELMHLETGVGGRAPEGQAINDYQ